MNDKIYEFATQAGLITFESIHDSMAVTPSIESVAKARKFAEMIILECMMLCGAVSGAAQVVRPNDAFGNGAEKCKALIKEHFGVEE